MNHRHCQVAEESQRNWCDEKIGGVHY